MSTKPFVQGTLEEACEIHLAATNDGELYRTLFTPVMAKLAAHHPKGVGYTPMKAYPSYLMAAHRAIAFYTRTYCGKGHRWDDEGALRIVVARMLECKYRQSVLMQAGLEAHEALLSFPCDEDLRRTSSEW